MATTSPAPATDLQSLLPAARSRKSLHGPAPGATPPHFELPPDGEPLPTAQPEPATASNTDSPEPQADANGAAAQPPVPSPAPPPAPPPVAEPGAAPSALQTATVNDQSEASGPHAEPAQHPAKPLRTQTAATAGPPPEAESPAALPQIAATEPQPRPTTTQASAQLPPLRLESDAPQHPQPARPTDTTAPTSAPAMAPSTASAPATPADIRISTPGDQALQVTLVAASPELRDRIAAGRSELRADLARVGAEVDLISVELRPQPGASSAQAGHSQQGSEWGGSGQADGGREMSAGDLDAGTLSDSDQNQPFAAADRSPDLSTDNRPEADAITGDPIVADATDGTADRDRNPPSGAQQSHQGSRGMADGGGHSPGHPFNRQPARQPDAQPAFRQALPASADPARTDSNRIDRYA